MSATAIVAGLAIAGAGAIYALTRLSSSRAEKVDCITYSDCVHLLYDSQVKETLAKNKAVRLVARRHNVMREGKEMTQVDVEWYDDSTKTFKPMSPPFSKVSEKLDEELTAKFGPRPVIFVKD